MGSIVQKDILRTPLNLELAVKTDNGSPIKATEESKVKLLVTLMLPTGPLRLQKVAFLVFNCPMDKVLLSQPLLKSMAFNLHEYLCKFKDHFQDADFSHVGFEKGDLHRNEVMNHSFKYLGITPVETALSKLPEPIDVTVGKSEKN